MLGGHECNVNHAAIRLAIGLSYYAYIGFTFTTNYTCRTLHSVLCLSMHVYAYLSFCETSLLGRSRRCSCAKSQSPSQEMVV